MYTECDQICTSSTPAARIGCSFFLWWTISLCFEFCLVAYVRFCSVFAASFGALFYIVLSRCVDAPANVRRSAPHIRQSIPIPKTVTVQLPFSVFTVSINRRRFCQFGTPNITMKYSNIPIRGNSETHSVPSTMYNNHETKSLCRQCKRLNPFKAPQIPWH